MADTNDTVEPSTTIPEFSGAENLKKLAEQLQHISDNMQNAAKNLDRSQVAFANKGVKSTAPSTDDPSLKKDVSKDILIAKKAAKGLEKTVGSISLGGSFSSGFAQASNLLDAVRSKLKGYTKDAQGLLKAGGAALSLGVMSEALAKLDEETGVFRVQQGLMDVEKEARTAGMIMGDSFSKSGKSVAAFRNELASSVVTTKNSIEEVTKVRGALKDAFGASSITAMTGLQGAMKGVTSSINATNVALLVGAARGMDGSKIAGMMSKAHLELGASIEESATMLGDIDIAAKDSGMSFEQVSDAVMAGADDLKMWGGTVGSVTPLFKKFSSVLGDGQKGLAPELLAQYTSGLKTMGFEMKALIGLQTGGGGGGGGTAMGAGLEMEELMGKGAEGMGQMSEKLIDTVKQFTGGKVITFEEARANPALEQQFIMQRKLLQRMVGGNDASSNKMLDILKNMDENGLSTGQDSKEALAEMMGAGESVQEATTSELKDAVLKSSAAQVKQGEKIVDAIKDIINKSPELKKIITNANKVTKDMAVGRYGMEGKAVRNLVKGVDSKPMQLAGTAIADGMDKIVGTSGKQNKIEMSKDSKSVQGWKQNKIEMSKDSKSVQGWKQNKIEMSKDSNSRQAGKQQARAMTSQISSSELNKALHATAEVIKEYGDKKKAGIAVTPAETKFFNDAKTKRNIFQQVKKSGVGVTPSVTTWPKADPYEMRERARRGTTGDTGNEQQSEQPEHTAKRNASTPERRSLPYKEAQDATEIVQRQKVMFDIETSNNKIEKEIVFKIRPDKSTVRIELDEEEFEKNFDARFKIAHVNL